MDLERVDYRLIFRMRVKLRHRRLAEELAKRPMSLNRWALKLGLSRGHLSELVNGRKRYPAPKTREKLLEGLSLSFEELFAIEYPTSGSSQKSKLKSKSSERRSGATMPHAFSLEHPMTDLRVAIRSLAKRPVLTVAAVLTLTLGIGSNSALFSLVHTLLWKPFPYGAPDQLVRVYGTLPERGYLSGNLSYPDFLEYRELAPDDVVEDIAVSDWEPYNLTTDQGPIRVGGGQISTNLFDLLRVDPVLGRTFTAEDEGASDVVLLSDALFRSHFGSDPSVIGRTLLVSGTPRVVVGVMPTASAYPEYSLIWVPLPRDLPRGANFLQATGRLVPGVSLAEANEALGAIATRIAERFPETHERRGVRVESLREAMVGDLRPLSFAVLGAVSFLLLIVCANVANLLLARGVQRQREMALRKALGATRARLGRQLLVEGLLLGVAGCTLGVAVGWLGVRALRWLVETPIPEWVRLELDPTILAYTIGLSLVSVFLFVIAPTFQATAAEVRANRQEGTPRLRSALVVGEIALSLLLLVGAGLMVTSLVRLASVDPGFRTEGRLTVGLDLLSHVRESPEERLVVYDRFLERMRAIPGVEAVGVVDRLPLKPSSNNTRYRVEGQTEEESESNPLSLVAVVSADYFEAMGIPVIGGSAFSDRRDDASDVIVSASFARRHWPEESPIGRRVVLLSAPDEPLTIRAVVGDVKHYGLDQETRPQLYFPYHAHPQTRMTWVLRATGDPLDLVGPVRAAVREVDAAQPLHEIMPLEEVVNRSAWMWRFFGRLFWTFALLALLLASVGLYGVLAYAVSQQTRELGVRMALGAEKRQLVLLVLGQGARLVAVGIAIGLPLSMAMGRAIATHLYGVTWFEAPATFSVVALLAAVAMLAMWVPARRASSVDPLTALRHE